MVNFMQSLAQCCFGGLIIITFGGALLLFLFGKGKEYTSSL